MSMRGFVRGRPGDRQVGVPARVLVFALLACLGSSGLLLTGPADAAAPDGNPWRCRDPATSPAILAEFDDIGVPVELVREAGTGDPIADASTAGPAVSPQPADAIDATEPPPAPFRVTKFTIAVLPVGARPYDADATPPLTYHPEYHDAAGVPMRMVDGRLVYKPAGLAQLAISYANGYRRTHDPAYLARADAIGRVFVRIGRSYAGGLYIPYRFNFAMHSNRADIIRNPWYSAMAQGLALSLFARLYQETADPSYLATADSLYRSLRHIGRGTNPWVSYIDASRYLWLEEYAQPYPEHTLNGFMFALFGLYDWYLDDRRPWCPADAAGSPDDPACQRDPVPQPGWAVRLLPQARQGAGQVPPHPHLAAALRGVDQRGRLLRVGLPGIRARRLRA